MRLSQSIELHETKPNVFAHTVIRATIAALVRLEASCDEEADRLSAMWRWFEHKFETSAVYYRLFFIGFADSEYILMQEISHDYGYNLLATTCWRGVLTCWE